MTKTTETIFDTTPRLHVSHVNADAIGFDVSITPSQAELDTLCAAVGGDWEQVARHLACEYVNETPWEEAVDDDDEVSITFTWPDEIELGGVMTDWEQFSFRFGDLRD